MNREARERRDVTTVCLLLPGTHSAIAAAISKLRRTTSEPQATIIMFPTRVLLKRSVWKGIYHNQFTNYMLIASTRASYRPVSMNYTSSLEDDI